MAITVYYYYALSLSFNLRHPLTSHLLSPSPIPKFDTGTNKRAKRKTERQRCDNMLSLSPSAVPRNFAALSLPRGKFQRIICVASSAAAQLSASIIERVAAFREPKRNLALRNRAEWCFSRSVSKCLDIGGPYVRVSNDTIGTTSISGCRRGCAFRSESSLITSSDDETKGNCRGYRVPWLVRLRLHD